MPIETIDQKLCNGCKLCVDVCYMDVLRMDEEKNKASIKYKEDCTVCYNCELICPPQAIYVSPTKGIPDVGYVLGFHKKPK